MTSKLLNNIYLTNRGLEKTDVFKKIFSFTLVYILISITVRYFVRDVLFRAGIYEEWFIDLTTIGPLIQAVLATAGLMHYTMLFGKYKFDIALFFKSIVFLGIGLAFFRWFIVLILGGGILVIVDIQDHGVVQIYIEDHFIIDVIALGFDWIMIRFFYKRSVKELTINN
jgi:hypothetical protein